MSLLLITSVGGSSMPVIHSISLLKPDRILFAVSPETRPIVNNEIIPSLLERGFEIGAGAYEIVEVQHAEDLTACVRRLRSAIQGEVASWRSRGEDYEVAIDITGGTKVMTAALSLVTHRLPCEIIYTGGTERSKGGLGVVIDGHEKTVQEFNPWELLGYAALEDAEALIDNGHYTAAHRVLNWAMTGHEERDLRRRLGAFQALASAYMYWERFQHQDAQEKLDIAMSMGAEFRISLGEDSARALLATLESNAAFLKSRGEPGWLVKDLIANALRRQAEGRYDDAVARIYRAIEALAQERLEKYDIFSTEETMLKSLPGRLAEKWKGSSWQQDGKGFILLGLQRDYEVLIEQGDELGLKFQELGLAGTKSPLKVRNNSILGHGFKAVGQDECGKLSQLFLELSGIDERTLPKFPVIGIQGRP